MKWWVYKCNTRNNPYNGPGDWRVFFDVRAASGQEGVWGLLSVRPALRQLCVGDMVFAYQTDRNELVGLVRVTRIVGDEVRCVAVEEFGVRVRDLKDVNPAIAAIPAFSPGPKESLLRISEEDAELLLGEARLAATWAC